jgi:hypothetical protein
MCTKGISPTTSSNLLLRLGICGLIVSQPIGFRLRSTLNRRELSAVETRFTGILFSRKSLSGTVEADTDEQYTKSRSST